MAAQSAFASQVPNLEPMTFHGRSVMQQLRHRYYSCGPTGGTNGPQDPILQSFCGHRMDIMNYEPSRGEKEERTSPVDGGGGRGASCSVDGGGRAVWDQVLHFVPIVRRNFLAGRSAPRMTPPRVKGIMAGGGSGDSVPARPTSCGLEVGEPCSVRW